MASAGNVPPIQAPYTIKAKPGRFWDVITDSLLEESYLRYLEASGQVFFYHPRPKFRTIGGSTYELDVYQIDPTSMLSICTELKPYRSPTWIVDNPEDTEYQIMRLMKIRDSLPHVGLALIPWAAEFTRPLMWLGNIPKPYGSGRWTVYDDRDADAPRRIGWDTLYG